ncbi:MAG: trigger factor [Patescibacteria group bacterium]
MKSSFKKLPGSKIELEIILDDKEFKSYWQEVYDQAIANVNLKGFRPGAAPKELAEQAINQDKIFEEAAKKATRLSLDQVTEENKWTLIDMPQITLGEAASGLKYKCVITIFPEINLGNYKKIAGRVLKEKKEAAVDSSEIEKSLEWLRNSRAKLTRANREARRGDVVEADIESFVDGKPIENARLKKDRFALGESRLMPGFDENLENRKEGEALNFIITAPQDYWQKDLRGKNVEFKVKINAVFDKQLPELNDDFAKGLGEFASIEELKKSLNDGIMTEKNQKETDRLRLKMLDEIAKDSSMEIPEIMIEKTLDSMAAEFKPTEELRNQLRDKARQNVANNLIIYKIAEMEKIQPTEDEVKTFGGSVDDPKKYQYYYGVILNQKVFKLLEDGK